MNQFATVVLVRCGKNVWCDKSVKLLLDLTQAQHMVSHLDQMSHQCHSKIELFQLCSAHEKYGV